MQNLDFNYIAAKNFLCFGPDGIELNLNKCSDIVLIKGSNLDVKNIDDDRTSSNGVGKSSIPEIIVYGLYGKTIKNHKKITHKNVINNKTGKNLEIEIRWGNFKLVRKRKPDSLRIWEDKKHKWGDETEITLGGMPATQKLIEEKIGLNYETFVNVLVFTDNNAGSFLECDAASKRQIIENLLSLDKYRDFADKAKELRKNKKDQIKKYCYEVENLEDQESQIAKRITIAQDQEDQWKENKKTEIQELEKKLSELKKTEIESSDQDMKLYLESQKTIEDLKAEVENHASNLSKIYEIIDSAKNKVNEHKVSQNSVQIEINNLENEIDNSKKSIEECTKEIEKFNSNKGKTCQFCFGEIQEKNYKKYLSKVKSKTKELEKLSSEKEDEKSGLFVKIEADIKVIKKFEKVVESAQDKQRENKEKTASANSRIKELERISKPENSDVNQKILEEKILHTEEQISDKKKESEKSPFIEIKSSLSTDLENKASSLKNKKEELSKAEKELPYYEFWVTAFGDSGIRKFIIDGIIPALNSKVAYWLQFLIDNKISLEFNNELDEKIERSPSDGDPFVYHAMSGGERRRLNLAVSQAFAHIMTLSSGVCPSLVFLDEVTTNIDPIGVVGVYSMISELAKDRKIFITTHDQNLLDLLQGCDLINLEKNEGFTTLK